MIMLDGKCEIGCSGYYYPQWKEKFYPRGTPPSRWLEYYSSVFNAVELNGTFYRTPTLESLKKYFNATPGEFRFSVKINKYITHILRMRGTKDMIADLVKLMEDGLEHKLSSILFQLPPSFVCNEENMSLLFENIPGGSRQVVELRHASWKPADMDLFKRKNITFCNSDYPGIENKFIATSSEFYMRLHGVPDLFKSSYSEKSLEQMLERIPRGCDTYHIFFNNTYYQAAYLNATSLMRMISGGENTGGSNNTLCPKVHRS